MVRGPESVVIGGYGLKVVEGLAAPRLSLRREAAPPPRPAPDDSGGELRAGEQRERGARCPDSGAAGRS